MSATVTYKGSTLTTAENQTRVLETQGKYLEDNITITDVTSGGYVTQDQDGYIVLPPTGGGTPSGGLEYETGIWTPTEDVVSEWISFSNNHSEYPILLMIEDTDISTLTGDSWTVCCINLWENYYGEAGIYRGLAVRRYVSNGTHGGGTTNLTSDSNVSYFFNDNGQFRPNGASTGSYWRAGRTYKWIAVWAPTS